MPAIVAADLARLRTTKHSTKLALAVYIPATIWTARINGAHSDGATSIAVDGVSQVRAPAKNFLVWFGTSAGACDLGKARFRSYSAPTLAVSPHNSALPDDAYITVKEVIQPEALHITMSASDVVSEDGNIAYTDQNLRPDPLGRIGPAAAAYRDDATGIATIAFFADPEAITPGATITAHAWDFADGTVEGTGLNTSAIQGTSGAPILVDFATAGNRYIRYTCTDSNGKTHTRFNPVLVYDRYSGTLPYTAIELNGIEGNVDSGGWRCELRVMTDAPVTAFPDLGMVVIFSDDYYGDERISIGGQWRYRENVVLVGYIVSDSVRQDWARQSVEFEIEGIGPLLGRLPGLGSGLETTAGTPGGWHVLQNMNYKLAAHHLLTQHATVSQIADVNLDLLTYTRSVIDLPEGSLLDQLSMNVCKPVRGRIGSSAQGMLYLESNPQLLPLASRVNPVVLSTTNADIRGEIALGDEKHTNEAAQVDFCGEDASANPVFSLAPARAWGTGNRITERIDGIRVASQAESNEIAGLWEGWVNNEFGDLAIDWRGNYRVFDVFPAEAVQVNMTAAQNRRDIVWANQRCWHKRVNYDIRSGNLIVSTALEKDSFGPTGITGEYPSDEPDLPPPFPPLDVDWGTPPAPTTGPALTPGKGNLLYVATAKGIGKCVGAYDGTPTWSAVNTGLSGGALTVYGINFDPWSASGGSFGAMWAMTADGLYYGTGCPTPTFTQKLSVATAAAACGVSAVGCTLGPSFAPSVRLQNFIATFLKDPTHNRWYLVWSTDNGANWQANTTRYWQISYNGIPQVQASAHVDDLCYIAMPTGYDNMLTGAEWDSDSPNATCDVYQFTISTGALVRAQLYLFRTSPGPNCLVFPYCNNAGAIYGDDSVGYFGEFYYDDGVNALAKCTSMFDPFYSHGYTPPAVTGNGDTTLMTLVRPTVALFINMWDEDYQAAVENAPGGNNYPLILSSIGGGDGNWTGFTGAQLVTGQVRNVFMVPADPNIVFFSAERSSGPGIANVQMTTDFGANWTYIDKQGEADGIDTVLSLGAGNTLATILIDYLKV